MSWKRKSCCSSWTMSCWKRTSWSIRGNGSGAGDDGRPGAGRAHRVHDDPSLRGGSHESPGGTP